MEIIYLSGNESGTQLECCDCGKQFVPESLPQDGFIGTTEVFAHCPDFHRGGRAIITCPPESPADVKKLRRRVEDALRKTTNTAILIDIAHKLNIKIS